MRFTKDIKQALGLTAAILVVVTAAPALQQQFAENVYEALFEEQVLRSKAEE